MRREERKTNKKEQKHIGKKEINIKYLSLIFILRNTHTLTDQAVKDKC